MSITQSFYDQLAPQYDKLFLDWNAATKEQAVILDRLFVDNSYDRSARVLDCACGIGTQAIGLAALGYPITASDLSEGALAQARERAAKNHVRIPFVNADFCALAKVFDEESEGVDGMIILIAGASHTGKTLLAQRLLEKYHYPYLSIDHLKMGLIRSHQTELTPMDDDKLTDYLWPIVREMVKTAIENGQNLTVEGCYIPFDWRKDFAPEYLRHIRCRFLIMTRKYIETRFEDIRNHGSAIEQRLDDSGLNMDELILENERNLRLCEEYGCDYILLDDSYSIDLEEIVK